MWAIFPHHRKFLKYLEHGTGRFEFPCQFWQSFTSFRGSYEDFVGTPENCEKIRKFWIFSVFLRSIVVWTKCPQNGNDMMASYYDVIMTSYYDVTTRHKCAKLRHFQNNQIFACNYQCNFWFLLQFLFVWFIYYTFCCVISLIYWFLNRFFHETLVDQNFGKPKFWQNFVIWTYIQASDFCCFKVSYCKLMFIINCKFLCASGGCTITA